MRKTIAFAAMLALAACNNADSDADDVDATATGEVADNSDVLEGEEPGFEAVAPGTYQVTRTGGEALGIGPGAQLVSAVAAHPDRLAGAEHRAGFGQHAEKVRLAPDGPAVTPAARGHGVEGGNARRLAARPLTLRVSCASDGLRASGWRFGRHPTG